MEGMHRLAVLWIGVAASGCGFEVRGGHAQVDAAPDGPPADVPDASVDPGIDGSMVVDAPMIDAPIEAPPSAVTTDHTSVADTFLSMINQTTNYSDQTSALADGDGRVALFRFDLSAIPTGATVSAAVLHIWTDTDAGQAVTFYPVLEAWDEAAATWQARQAQVMWSGAGASPPSRSTVAAGTVTGNSPNTEYTMTISIAVVAGWVANPSSNYGFAITTPNTDGTRFSTREHPTTTRRPYLRVTHAP